MVSRKLATDKPDAVRGLVRAINKAMREVLASPDAAIELLAKKEPLLNVPIEKQRLIYATKTLIATRETAELGIGDVNDSRMAQSVDTIVTAFELPRAPAVTDVFSRSFLPPKAERALPALGN
jgi:NitT/TauT family transport system substrate-binding protein